MKPAVENDELLASVSPDRWTNMIRLGRNGYKQSGLTYVLVEGKADWLMFKRFLDEPSRCHVIYEHGWTNVLATLEALQADGYHGIVAIVDRDYALFCDKDPRRQPNADLLMTDTRDLETMMLSAGILDRVVAQLADPNLLRQLEGDFSAALANAGLPLGYVRLESELRGLMLSFDKVMIEHSVDPITLRPNIDQLLDDVQDCNRKKLVDGPFLAAMKKQVRGWVQERQHDPWYICCGHDLVKILGHGLAHGFGNKRGKSCCDETQLFELLVREYDDALFRESRLCDGMRHWELQNSPFCLLKQELLH